MTLVESATSQPEAERDLEQRARPYRALYEHWEANQWSPLDLVLDVDVDVASFAALGEEEQAGFAWIFAHRFHAEFTVATVLAPFVTRAADYELQLCLATQVVEAFGALAARLLETGTEGGMDTQVLSDGTDARGFQDEAMRLWQLRLRSIGYLD